MQHIYRPVQVLVTIPAVAYVMVQYSSALVWFTVVATTQSEYLALPPYNFGTTGIGLLNLPPFIGSVLGCVWGGPVSDWSIKFLARRNEGVYEPEMRLYISLVPGIVGPAGLFLYGYSVSEGLPWVFPCLGSGLYGFSMAALIPIALTYLTDSYNKILGTALIGVSFAQYMFATIIIFALDSWISSMGLYSTFTAGYGFLLLAMQPYLLNESLDGAISENVSSQLAQGNRDGAGANDHGAHEHKREQPDDQRLWIVGKKISNPVET
ncbi:hypothetical protein N7471_013665 [Penicillium samsonianum]|uniref:uncharacterized protein n=1 Tax=Penicillium samsonianum TaxID=1882272 RepID=UPI00254914C9|nr:uncharacterized protein N7471_013665 [Penicillium samsonianum]KAJ6118198.1 hypothetical protein N7471_013665 [Penicillium samsonianum]